MNTIHTIFLSAQKTSSIEPREVELLLMHAISKSREFVLAHPEYTLTANEERKIHSFLNRRKRGEPIAYILGTKEFFKRDFLVTPATLIPRPETEILLEEVLLHLTKGSSLPRYLIAGNYKKSNIPPLSEKIVSPQEKKGVGIVDVGTGSGCLLISIKKELENFGSKTQNSKFIGLDISKKAIAIAKRNAKKHNVKNETVFFQSNLLEYCINHPSMMNNYSSLIILANLPYVPSDYLKRRKKTKFTEGLSFEPLLALDGGKDGFVLYRKLLTQIKKLKKIFPHTRMECFFEIGSDQRSISTHSIEKKFPNSQPLFLNDLSRHTRVVRFSP